MYIDPFVAGIFATLLFEFIAFVVAVILKSGGNDDKAAKKIK